MPPASATPFTPFTMLGSLSDSLLLLESLEELSPLLLRASLLPPPRRRSPSRDDSSELLLSSEGEGSARRLSRTRLG
ncbi:hypothetical protein PI125_g3176 [Phytophthora idaei]|nr:hypothetical protein PI125_g3176 [Phytophthora idaei]KAG3171524.1 hypothetical protein PI126_g1817 [Phytophthora idaei]